MIEQALDLAPPPIRVPAETTGYNAVENEPNLDLLLKCRRRLDPNGKPASEWEYGYAIEGEWKGALTQSQRDYAAAFMRHIADLIQEPLPDEARREDVIAALGRRYQANLRAARDGILSTLYYLVKHRGVHHTASVMGMKEREVTHLLRSHGRVAEQHPALSKPEPQRRDVLRQALS